MAIKTAIVIKGNPILVDGNALADLFYADIKSFLESLGFSVSFDSGEPYTAPPSADLWIGHSRGVDRLRFAPPKTIKIGIGVPKSVGRKGKSFPIVNHPEDKLATIIFKSGKIIEGKDVFDLNLDSPHHYMLTEEMKSEIIEILKRGGLY